MEVILDNINIDFKNQELVFILGVSGSGKSTLLNIIGGMLEIDSGSIMLDNQDITKFNHQMMCYYRNNMIGFIHQDYHLVEYMSVVDNIKLGQTIKNNNQNMNDLLKKLGIYNKKNTCVNRLSGGEKQRVAIARAIINNPDIILCDEPTGALDSHNSIKIMNILKEISQNKLVIVVSHDEELAKKYADRIININDGKVEYNKQEDCNKFHQINKKKISLLSIIKLAIKNLSLKKMRTIFTSIAISIGFICMVLVLCLSKSFNEELDKLEKDIVSNYPINIYNGEFTIPNTNLSNSKNDFKNKVVIKNKEDYLQTNKINIKYINYLKQISEISYLGYNYDISMPIISDRYQFLDNQYLKILPSNRLVYDNYTIVYGKNITSMNEILLKLDSNNCVDSELLRVFNIKEDINYQDLIGRKLKIILNDEYYLKNGEYYYINNDLKQMYYDSEIELSIVGIIKEKTIIDDSNYLYYSQDLVEHILNINSQSQIVKEQLFKDYNLLGVNLDKNELLSFLGYESLPTGINIYVNNLSDKEIVLKKLDKYNEDNPKEKLIYVDVMQEAIDLLKNIINVITIILVVFSLISIFVSSLMIFILTNNRVMERIKEIGILKSLGARKKDITRLFNIENLIISIIASFIGIIIINILVNPINNIMSILLEDDGMFKVYPELLLICTIFNILITIISGYFPAKIAGRKNIIDCINNRH